MRWQLIALCLEALALILVPSSTTVPSFTSPIFRASRTTSTNSLENVSRCCCRKRLMVRKSGRPPAAARIALMEGTQVELIDGIGEEIDQMIFGSQSRGDGGSKNACAGS